jgi:hypothetical protein
MGSCDMVFLYNTFNQQEATDGWVRTGSVSSARRLTGLLQFNQINQLAQIKCHAIMPTHHKRIVDFTHGREHVAMKNSDKDSAQKPRSRWRRCPIRS